MSVNVYENGQLKSIAGSSGVEVINNLNSTDIDKALSANQGRILNENKIDINLENIDDSGIERIKEIAGGGVPENIVLHSPSEEEVEVPIIDADKLGGELPEYYENELYLANESTPSTPSPRDADRLGGQLPSYYAKQSDVDKINPYVIKYKDVNIGTVTIGEYGYVDVGRFIPSNIIVVGASIQTFGSSTKHTPFNITATGIYMIGMENDVISNVVIRYYYYDR